MCRVLGAFGERGVFKGCEFAFESLEQAVGHQPLTVVELHITLLALRPVRMSF
jgi:hypothetical protein